MTNKDTRSLEGFDSRSRQLYTLSHPSSLADQRPASSYKPSLKSHPASNSMLEHLSVLYHVVTIYPLIPFLLVAAYTLFHPLYTLSFILLSLLVPHTLICRSRNLRSLSIWHHLASYFPMTLYRSVPLPPTKKYILGYHPHGVLSHGAFAAFATEALGFSELFPGIENTLLTLSSSFQIPIYGIYLRLLGMGSVSRESCQSLLTTGGRGGQGSGKAITIVVGGAKESLEAVPNSMRLVLRNRKGFVKLAIQTGASLVPVVGFGENELYDMDISLESQTLSGRVQRFFKEKFGFTVPFFYARGPNWFDMGIMPYRRGVNVVVGRPIEVEMVQGAVGQDHLNEVHGKYVEEVERIWRVWKGVFSPGAGEMVIV
ncbi:diacylglycerol acyltransferase-domain-containing protein [Aspergillus karnatakaensis]|uniref:diacylglycerol acyltransferase-domain-containing protein n=1 Tax=Aspergillus karnatakaensis TaxID=1810916 RepID=UPI003CCD69BF